jgi:hypothetical protein
MMRDPLIIEYCDVLGNPHTHTINDEKIAGHIVNSIILHAEHHKIPLHRLKFRLITKRRHCMAVSVALPLSYGNLFQMFIHYN